MKMNQALPSTGHGLSTYTGEDMKHPSGSLLIVPTITLKRSSSIQAQFKAFQAVSR
jgi:hypothetical protein